MRDPRILETTVTYFAEHNAEDKRAGRLVARAKECVERDPKRRDHVALGTEANK